MDTLMEEPVILPKSRAVVDRSTINRCVCGLLGWCVQGVDSACQGGS